MKTSIKIAALALTLAFFAIGCNKMATSEIANEIKQENVRCENGVLIFATNDAMNETLNMLSTMTNSELETWENNLGFRSQQTLHNNMNAAERKQEETLYAGQNPELSREQLAQLGYPFQHSAEFVDLERKGLAKEIQEANGNYSIQLTIGNAAMAYLTNETGEVMIEGMKLSYNGTQVKVTNANDEIVAEYDESSRITNAWSTTSLDGTNPDFFDGNGWKTDPYNGSGRRVRAIVTGTSTSLPNTYCTVVHTYDIQAERLLFGNWAYRNTYNPIYSATGTWSYAYTLSNSTYHTNDLNSGSGQASGFTYTIGSSNHLLLTLKPNGLWNASPNTWVSTVDALSYNYSASFSGGADGWGISRNSPSGSDGNWTYNP
jgi:hypothetical protein